MSKLDLNQFCGAFTKHVWNPDLRPENVDPKAPTTATLTQKGPG